MRQVAAVLSVVVLIAVGFAVFFMSSSGTGGAAWADIVRGLSGVKTVHMTGEVFYMERSAVIPLALYRSPSVFRTSGVGR